MKFRSRFFALVIGMILMFSTSITYGQINDKITNTDRYESYLKFFALVQGSTVTPHWYADGNRFWFAGGTPENTVIYLVDPKKNTKKVFFDKEHLRNSLRPFLDNEPINKGIPFTDFTFVNENENGPIQFVVEGKKFQLNLNDYKIVPVKEIKEAIKLLPSQIPSPDKKSNVSIKDNNLWLGDSINPKKAQLTFDGADDYPWDVQPNAWSPDGKLLFVKRSDGRKVHHLPVINYSTPIETVDYNVYAKTGGAIEIPELFVLNASSKKQVKIDLGMDSQQYVFPLGWRPDGSEVLFMRLSRLGNKLELLAANANTGVSRVILVEEQKTFVGGLDFLISNWKKQFTPLKGGNKFIWISERDGWKHLYLYGMDGKLLCRLTTGDFPVTGVVKVDEKANWIYFTANGETNLYSTNLYRVDFKGENFKKLTEAKGLHNYLQFSPSGSYFIDRYSSPEHPYSVELRSTDGKFLQALRTTDISKLQAIGFNPPESFVVKADDGVTDLYGIMYKPYDFDPTKKYPVIEFVYAGPFMSVVPHGFMPSTGLAVNAQALAQLGYITIMIDTRGSTERSKAFQDVVYENIGKYEIADRVAALKQLGDKHPFMDMKRIGIYGHSWGGYYAIRAMLMAPDIYRVGIASAPGELTEGAEINELYMKLPSDNKAGYEFGTNTNHAANLKGKLLFIHGTSDINAPLSTTIRMIDALIKADKPYDLLLLPGRTHYLEGEKYVTDAICRYFDENLKNKKE
ncbi:S9 family peptidase [Flavobacterium sp. LS1R49]|uniref:S9 family peptidase n=1 Tax=Flavobacterium shii TaxID=2987687 RepID=A0A9X2ZDT8_9FLAO|nr:S9 family peptidase [Flavobacterium shii]MCV9926702.1 S9 family peptidase [Flavobacterium shii]